MQSRKGKQINLDGRSRIANYQSVFRFDFGADHLSEVEDRYWSFRLAVFFGDHRIASLPIGAARIPCRMVAEPNRILLTQKVLQKSPGIGMDWLLQVRRELFKFRLVDIHNCLMCAPSQVLRCVSGDCEIQPYANSKKKI